jgi:hypothetical protein
VALQWLSTGTTTVITFLGDAYLPRPVDGRDAMLCRYVVNLEAPVTDAGTPAPGKVNLKVSGLHFEVSLAEAPLAVCLANNHVMDFGAVGLLDTMSRLRQLGIVFFGAGTRADNHHNPTIVEVDGLKVALSGYACSTTAPIFAQRDGHGVAPLDLEAVKRDILRARRSGADRIVVSLHWGAEEVSLPRPKDVFLARAIIDAGADAIVGHHPHVIQPWELRGERPIFYSLGNFIMPDLDVPSYFTAEEATARSFVKRQAPWNRSSLAFTYEPRTRMVATSSFRFDGTRVMRSPRGIRPTRSLGIGGLYATRFRLAFIYGKLRQLAFDYLRQPRMPRLRHLRFLMRLLKSREYR